MHEYVIVEGGGVDSHPSSDVPHVMDMDVYMHACVYFINHPGMWHCVTTAITPSPLERYCRQPFSNLWASSARFRSPNRINSHLQSLINKPFNVLPCWFFFFARARRCVPQLTSFHSFVHCFWEQFLVWELLVINLLSLSCRPRFTLFFTHTHTLKLRHVISLLWICSGLGNAVVLELFHVYITFCLRVKQPAAL